MTEERSDNSEEIQIQIQAAPQAQIPEGPDPADNDDRGW